MFWHFQKGGTCKSKVHKDLRSFLTSKFEGVLHLATFPKMASNPKVCMNLRQMHKDHEVTELRHRVKDDIETQSQLRLADQGETVAKSLACLHLTALPLNGYFNCRALYIIAENVN